MSGLSSSVLNMMGRGVSSAATKERSFKFDLPGNVPDIRFCDGPCKDSKELDTNTGGGKWMYDQVAQSFGYNPKAARSSPEQNNQVLVRMYAGINAAIDATKARGKTVTSVEWHSQFRTSLAAVRDKHERSTTQTLNQQARLASLPGASALADPAVRGVVQAAVNLEVRALGAVRPELAAAAQTGLTAGATIAFLAADQLAALIPQTTDPKPNDTPSPEQKPRTPLAVALDTDHDGKLLCREIGVFVKEVRNEKDSINAYDYQAFITGRPGEDFHVVSATASSGNVKFDGCKDRPEGPILLEAKADHGGLLGGGWSKAETKNIPLQGKNQDEAAKALGVQNEWHAQTSNDQEVIKDIFKKRLIDIPVYHTPKNPSDK